MKKTDIVDYTLISAGLGVSLQDIQSILSIIIICLDILWIIAKFIVKFFQAVSDGKITDEEAEELETIVNEADKFKGGGK